MQNSEKHRLKVIIGSYLTPVPFFQQVREDATVLCKTWFILRPFQIIFLKNVLKISRLKKMVNSCEFMKFPSLIAETDEWGTCRA